MAVAISSNISEKLCDHKTDVQEALVSETATLISSEFARMFQFLCYGIFCQTINIFGTVTNIINIVCFIKQGFQETINISLLGLAISDIGCLVTMMWSCICLIPDFQDADLPFDPIDIQYLTTGTPHVIFTRVTSCITAFITLERCLCITLPLQVKDIFTTRRVTIIIIFIFVILIASVSPIYYVSWFDMKFVPERNRTVLGVVFTENRILVEQICFAINYVAIPFTALLTILICMTIIVTSLRRQAKWRRTTLGSLKTDADKGSSRDQRVARTVLMISVVFVICFTPSCALFLAMVIEPGLSLGGKYLDMSKLLMAICIIFESVNSSMNIFIYYNSSSRYRAVFRTIMNNDKKI